MDEKGWMRKVGKRLHLLRIEFELQQQEVADYLGVGPSTVAHYEKGRRAISAYTIYRLSIFYKVPTDYLTGVINHREAAWGQEEMADPHIRYIARSITEEYKAEKLREVAKAMFPEDFQEEKEQKCGRRTGD